MSLSTIAGTLAPPVPEDRWYCWPTQVDWSFYTKLERLRGAHGVPRLIYLDGSLYLMTPSLTHEALKERLAALVHEIVTGLDLPCRATGQTTWRRPRKVGVEGDLTYYLQHEPNVRTKTAINLRDDPPPDLAIEVVYSHDAAQALEVYRRLRVPEVWIVSETGLEVLCLRTVGNRRRYEASASSLAFPFVHASEIADWVHRPLDSRGGTRWARDVRAWVLAELAPRIRPGGPGR